MKFRYLGRKIPLMSCVIQIYRSQISYAGQMQLKSTYSDRFNRWFLNVVHQISSDTQHIHSLKQDVLATVLVEFKLLDH